MLATAGCALSTAAAAAASSLEALVFARVAMGACTAAIVPLSIAWIGDTVPLALRQQALARFSGITVLGMLLGPLAGGFLAETLSWRAPFVVLACLFGGMSLVLHHRTRSPLARPQKCRELPGATPYLRQLRRLMGNRQANCVFGASCIEGALGIAFLLLALMPHWGWAVVACTMGGFGFFMLHNPLQLRATQLSVESTGLAVSLFSCSNFMGQSVGVGLGAMAFALGGTSPLFAVAAIGLLLLGLGVAQTLRSTHRQPTSQD